MKPSTSVFVFLEVRTSPDTYKLNLKTTRYVIKAVSNAGIKLLEVC